MRPIGPNLFAHFTITRVRTLTGTEALERVAEVRCAKQPADPLTNHIRRRARSFSWILSNPPLLKTTTTSFGRSIGMIRSTIALAFCS